MATILIIEDDNDLRHTLKKAILLDQHEAIEAEDGNNGLEILEKNSVDMVITDIFMPNKEGLETIEEIKSRFPSIKIIAMSGGGKSGFTEFLDFALEMGADKAFLKPVDLDQLLETIRKLQQ